MYLAEKDLLPDITFHSFLEQEITRNKKRVLPDLVPFPLPVSAEILRSPLVVTGRKIDSDLWELIKEGELDLNGILKLSLTIERTHLLFVDSPHCSTKWANLPPIGITGRSKIGSGEGWLSEFVEDEACLAEGNCLVLLLLLV